MASVTIWYKTAERDPGVTDPIDPDGEGDGTAPPPPGEDTAPAGDGEALQEES